MFTVRRKVELVATINLHAKMSADQRQLSITMKPPTIFISSERININHFFTDNSCRLYLTLQNVNCEMCQKIWITYFSAAKKKGTPPPDFKSGFSSNLHLRHLQNLSRTILMFRVNILRIPIKCVKSVDFLLFKGQACAKISRISVRGHIGTVI